MPQITIDLSDEAYALLAQRAQKNGQSPEGYVTHQTERVLSFINLPGAEEQHAQRKIVTGMQGFISTLLLDEDGTMFSPSDRLEFYQILERELGRLREYMDGGQVETESVSALRLVECPVREVVEAAHQRAIRSAYRKPTHQIEVDIDAEVPEVWSTDRMLLLEGLCSLLENALKYSPEGGEVRLSVSLDTEAHLHFAVSDQGLGLSAEFLPKLNTLLSHYEPPNRDNRSIGGEPWFPVLRRLVVWQGGRCWANSTGLLEGTTIAFTLPSISLPLLQDSAYQHALETVYRHCLRLVRASEGLAERHGHYDDAARADLQRTLQTEVEALLRFMPEGESSGLE